MSNPRTEHAYRAWWAKTELPMLQADYPDMTADDLDGWWALKLDAMVDDKRLPQHAIHWGRRRGDTMCECGHKRGDHVGRTGAGKCDECGRCYKFKAARTGRHTPGFRA